MQNVLRPVDKIEKCRMSKENLIADFVQLSGAFAKFLVLEGKLGSIPALSFENFLKFPHFLRS